MQAQDRAHRIGQTNDVRVFRLISSTDIEDKIVNQAQSKKDMEAVVIHAGHFQKDAIDDDKYRFYALL